jgi:hypothetical protein
MSEQILEIGKIKKALKSFNQTIRVDVNTIGAKQEDKEPETEKELISKVKLNFLDDEWGETVEALAEAGLDLEEEEAETVKGITINVSVKDMEFFKVLSQALTQIYIATEEENTKEIIEEALKRIGVGKEEE